MLDLGTGFVASVARDPGALAIVDGSVRLTYAQWYARISSLIMALDRIGLKPAALGLSACRDHHHAGQLARQGG
jgi:2-furoate---CoA ligase